MSLWACRVSCLSGAMPCTCLVLFLMAVLLCHSAAPAGGLTPAGNATATNTTAVAPGSPFTVFGYLPEYRQARFRYEAFFASGLTHLVFFSAEVDPVSLQLTHVHDRLPPMAQWRTIRELADQYGVKLLLCIGGAGRSMGFPKLVGNVLGRRRFVREVQRVVQERELDGIDFNWEYPESMTEWLSFGQLLLELRAALTAAAANGVDSTSHHARARPALLTMALHPHPTIPSVLRSSRVLPSLDYLHWMAYDNIVADDAHSSVAYAAAVLQDAYIGNLDDTTYRAHLPQGPTAEPRGVRKPGDVDHRRKLCLGIPFYGRHREDRRVPPETYEHLWQFIQQWARKRQPTWVEGGPELRALSHYAGYDYTGYDDVKRKMRLARSAGVAGIMIWELGQDVPPGTSPMSLMSAVQEQLMDWKKATDIETRALHMGKATDRAAAAAPQRSRHGTAQQRNHLSGANETGKGTDELEEDL